MAQGIAEKVMVTVTAREHTRLVAARHVSPDVYESYMRGLLAAHNTPADLEQDITYFEAAIRKDPTFAPAYLGLAKVYLGLGTVFAGYSPTEMYPKVLKAARKLCS